MAWLDKVYGKVYPWGWTLAGFLLSLNKPVPWLLLVGFLLTLIHFAAIKWTEDEQRIMELGRERQALIDESGEVKLTRTIWTPEE